MQIFFKKVSENDLFFVNFADFYPSHPHLSVCYFVASRKVDTKGRKKTKDLDM